MGPLREQWGHSVLWLPLRGLSEERINGSPWLAEPGMGLLFQPGDRMQGETSEEIEGVFDPDPGSTGSPAATFRLPMAGGGATGAARPVLRQAAGRRCCAAPRRRCACD